MLLKMLLLLEFTMLISNNLAQSTNIPKSQNHTEPCILESLLSKDKSTCLLLTYSLQASDISVSTVTSSNGFYILFLIKCFYIGILREWQGQKIWLA